MYCTCRIKFIHPVVNSSLLILCLTSVKRKFGYVKSIPMFELRVAFKAKQYSTYTAIYYHRTSMSVLTSLFVEFGQISFLNREFFIRVEHQWVQFQHRTPHRSMKSPSFDSLKSLLCYLNKHHHHLFRIQGGVGTERPNLMHLPITNDQFSNELFIVFSFWLQW